MRAWRVLVLLLVAPLAAPDAAPTLVAGRAHAVAEEARVWAPREDPAPLPSPVEPTGDGVVSVRSWIVEPPAPPSPPVEWSEGVWTPLERTSAEASDAPPPIVAPPPAQDASPAPSDPVAPDVPPADPPGAPDPGHPEPGPPQPPSADPGDGAAEPPAGLPCLLCVQVAQLDLKLHRK